jgi:membrane protein
MPGIATSMVLWMLGAYGFSLYLAAAPSYSITYGTLAGVIVTLLFFYLTGMAILLGAQVNAVLMTFRRPSAADRAP